MDFSCEGSPLIWLGMIPAVPRERIETIPNGAGLGAAMFLDDEGFALGEKLAARAEQIDLDQDANFIARYVDAMILAQNREIGGNYSLNSNICHLSDHDNFAIFLSMQDFNGRRVSFNGV